MDGEGPRSGPGAGGAAGVDQPDEAVEPLPLLPGFREMALRRMAEERRRLARAAPLLSRRDVPALR